jgi:tetratricopeptide (TPR) repeat protein
MALKQKNAASVMEIDRLATQLAKDPHSKAFLPLAEEYCKVGMWEEAVSVLEDGLKHYPGFITAMVVLGRAYDQLNQPTKARAVLEGATKLSPENLRAHRILIKLYVAQGMTEEALKSCRVILTMNPRDEETLSVQASLGVQPEPQEPKKTTAAVKANTMAREHASEPSVPSPEPTTTPTAEEPPKAVLAEPVPQLGEPVAPINEAFATDSPISVATSIMEQALHENDHLGITKQTSIDARPNTTGAAAGPSTSAETITQLESWLRSIERQRRDRRISGDSGS